MERPFARGEPDGYVRSLLGGAGRPLKIGAGSVLLCFNGRQPSCARRSVSLAAGKGRSGQGSPLGRICCATAGAGVGGPAIARRLRRYPNHVRRRRSSIKDLSDFAIPRASNLQVLTLPFNIYILTQSFLVVSHPAAIPRFRPFGRRSNREAGPRLLSSTTIIPWTFACSRSISLSFFASFAALRRLHARMSWTRTNTAAPPESGAEYRRMRLVIRERKRR